MKKSSGRLIELPELDKVVRKVAKGEKTERNNQWATANVEVTGKSGESKKTERNNQWASTSKKTVE